MQGISRFCLQFTDMDSEDGFIAMEVFPLVLHKATGMIKRLIFQITVLVFLTGSIVLLQSCCKCCDDGDYL